MANEPHDDNVRSLWQRQRAEGWTASPDDMRRRVDDLTTQIRRRDLGIYVSGAVIVPSWAAVIWFLPDLWMMAGAGLAAAVCVLYQLRKRSAARAIPSDLAGRPCLEFHRRLLERERDLYRKMPVWFLLPVGLSQIPILLSLLTSARFPHTPLAVMFVLALMGSGIAALVVGRNKWHHEAIALQREIESLKAVDRST